MQAINPDFNRNEAARYPQTNLVNWADWWDEWGNKVFDPPATLVDIEPQQNNSSAQTSAYEQGVTTRAFSKTTVSTRATRGFKE